MSFTWQIGPFFELSGNVGEIPLFRQIIKSEATEHMDMSYKYLFYGIFLHYYHSIVYGPLKDASSFSLEVA